MALVEDIISLLEASKPMTAREICYVLNLEPEREKDVYEALKKAGKVLRRKGRKLMMQPPVCKSCGFELAKMKASRCPRCKSERIEPARFYID